MTTNHQNEGIVLSKRFRQELENVRRAILAMNRDLENKAMKRCFEIGIHEDGLTGSFVRDRLAEVMQGE